MLYRALLIMEVVMSNQNNEDEIRMLKQNIRFLKRERSIIYRTITIQKCIITFLIATIIGLSIYFCMRINVLNGNIDSVNFQKTMLIDAQSRAVKLKLEAEYYLSIMTNVAYRLELENQELVDDNQTLMKEFDELNADYEELSEREELFDKYEYAIIRSNHTRTDITYDNLKHLEDIAREEGISQDGIDLCLSFVMNESNGIENAANAVSSARGYGQLLSSTGRFCYTELMGNSSYNHNVDAMDGEKNLEMTLRYLAYLDDCKPNTEAVVRSYCGGWNEGYVAKLNRYLSKGPTPVTIKTLRIHSD